MSRRYFNVKVYDKYNYVQVDRFGIEAENKTQAKKRARNKVIKSRRDSVKNYLIELDEISKESYKRLF